jgi:ABC-type glutathione transport system ATPase component
MSELATPALEIDGLHVALGHPHPQPILHDVSLRVQPGEIVGLIGETGSGKTTIARSILGLHDVQSGSILVHGEQVVGLHRSALRTWRRRGLVQYVFQDPLRSLDPDFTVERSVLEGVTVRRSLTTAERKLAVADALALVGLDPGLAMRRPSELSGGQRQRVAIARAMAVGPGLLICDEPVSALDAASRIHILDLLRTLAKEQGVGILLITHDLGSLAGIADEIVVLYNGHVVEAGNAATVLLDAEHPYTQLLVASVPTLHGLTLPAEERQRLRARVASHSGGAA